MLMVVGSRGARVGDGEEGEDGNRRRADGRREWGTEV